MSITYAVCVSVVLAITACKAHAPYYIFVCAFSGCTIFFHISHNRREFRDKGIERKMCVWILSGTFVILRRTEVDIIKNVLQYLCKVPFIFVRF